MKPWKKLSLILIVLILLSQVPFAYRRYRLGRLNAVIQVLNADRRIPDSNPRFAEYRGVVHVHSFLGGHSSGSFAEIISGAQANQLQFVIMTEHPEKDFNTAEMTLKGIHGGVLFVNGNELRATSGDRLLMIPGLSATADGLSTKEIVATAKPTGSINVYTDARQINPLIALFDTLWSHRSYPDLLFANFYQRPAQSLKKWDEALTRRRLTATAGNDAHANVGVSLNDYAGHTLLGLRLDPYETSFHLVRLHVLVPKDKGLDTGSLLQAIATGHCFIGFDLFTDTSGFSFAAENPGETKIQGDEITLRKETHLKVSTPVSSRIVLFKDGNVVLDENGLNSKQFSVTERGVYRVEVYLPQLGKPIGEQPWIISNPIYVR